MSLRAHMSDRRVATLALAACLTASCSATSAPPPAAKPTTYAPPATVASKVVPPPTETSPLAKDWKSYGGTAFFGCPEQFTGGKSALEDIRPKVFDPKTGQFASPDMPMIPAPENVTGARCALSTIVGEVKFVYVITTAKPAQAPAPEAPKPTAYFFDLKASQPLATKEL